MYRFFVEEDQIANHQVSIRGKDAHHIRHVLRMKAGEEFCVSTGGKAEYRCAVSEYREDEVVAEVRFVQEKDLELASEIYLFQGIPKGDKMELIIQKAVELGVREIIPVDMKRCVVKLDAKKEASKCKRWNAIAESAAKQAKRMVIPKVCSVMGFAQALDYARQCDVCLMPYELAAGMQETKRIIETIKPGQSVAVLIGPEGGFAQEEAEAAREAGARLITLGRRILRTETAGMTTLSILMYHLETE